MAPPRSAFQLENFVPLPSEELICSICFSVFYDPVECLCHHVFCQSCIESWLVHKRSCPICRERINIFSLRSVVLIKNIILKLIVKCPNVKFGCTEKVSLENCEYHLTNCLYELVKCQNEDCPVSLIRKNINNHEQKECKYRLVRCKCECQLQFPWFISKKHNCLEELKKKLAEKEEVLKTLKKQLLDEKQELKHIHQELEELQTVPYQHSENEEEFPYLHDCVSTNSDLINSSEVDSNHSYVSSCIHQMQENAMQSCQDESSGTSFSSSPVKIYVNVAQKETLPFDVNEVASTSSSHSCGPGVCNKVNESISKEKLRDKEMLHSLRYGEDTEYLPVECLQNTSLNNEGTVQRRCSNIINREDEENESNYKISFTKNHILKRKVPGFYKRNDSGNMFVKKQVVSGKNEKEIAILGKEIESNSEKSNINKLKALSTNSLDKEIGLPCHIFKSTLTTSHGRELDYNHSIVSDGEIEENKISKIGKTPEVSGCHFSQYITNTGEYKGLPYKNLSSTAISRNPLKHTNYSIGDVEGLKRSPRNHVKWPINKSSDSNKYITDGKQVSFQSTTQYCSYNSSLEQHTQNSHAFSTGFHRTLALLEKYSVDNDPDWEPPSLSLQSELCGTETTVLRRSDRQTVISHGECEENDPEWEPPLWTESSDNSSEEWESDSSYEVEVPPRTWDLLEQYCKDDSDEDSDWAPNRIKRKCLE